MADWSRLPYDIIHKLTTHLIAVEDFVSFSAVCTSWRSVHLAKQWNQVPQIPFLMFCDNENDTVRSCVSLYTNNVYKSDLPEARGCRCWGSSLGWLVTLGSDLKIHLLNPFTRASVDLPPKSSLHIHFGEILDKYEIIEKAFVFNNPHGSVENELDLLVMIIYGPLRQLGFCRPGYSSWISIEDDNDCAGFIDVSCVKGRIVALSHMGSLVRVDIAGRSFVDIECPRSPELFPHWDWEQLALVESPYGDLWMVHQNRSGNRRSFEFIVYSYDFDKKRWIRLSGLGDCAIFMGDNCCVCVCVPDLFECRRNCIYFVGKESERRWPYREILAEVGVFCVEDGSCGPLSLGPESPSYYSFPIWVTPALH